MVRIHRLAVCAILFSSIFYEHGVEAKKKKKKVKKATEGEPAYRIENYQENVPPPEDLARQMAAEREKELQEEEESMKNLLKTLGWDDDDDDPKVRKLKEQFAEKQQFKDEKREENLAEAALRQSQEQQAYDREEIPYDDSDEDAPLEDYRDPISENYQSSYEPLAKAETFEFEAEVHRMLDIVINSLYQNKDVFLRELISNASDALDKIRFLSLTDPTLLEDESVLEVKVQYDRDLQTLTITDTGIGMTKFDLIENLGTVAKSGTTSFLNAIQEGSSSADTMNMIGQFGVGFYSVFLVADAVSVASKHPSKSEQYIWTSSYGAAAFDVGVDPRGTTLTRGTEITLHLKGDCLHYIDPFKLEKLVSHYSEFVTYPISVRTTATLKVAAVSDEDEDEEDLDDGDAEDEDDDEEEEEELEDVISHSWKRVNANQAIWTRDKETISDEEYRSFFSIVTKDASETKTTAAWSHFNAEGNINFKSILYLPSDLPEFSMHMTEEEHLAQSGLKLYVRKVLISDQFRNLLPDYLSFVRGVVDSDDLPLNVNRETLQESKIIKVISKKVTRKAIEMIRTLARTEWPAIDEDTGEPLEDDLTEHPYITWYEKFHPALKRGVLEDPANQKRILKLLRYKTTKLGGTEYRSLEEIAADMKDWQDDFYFIAGSDLEEVQKSVFLQKFNAKGIEVMLLTDPFDEYLLQNLSDFEGHRFTSITQDGIKFEDEDQDLVKRRSKAYNAKFKPLVKYLKKLYGDAVSRVTISERLVDDPAVMSNAAYAHSANMERVLKAQAHQHGQNPDQYQSHKIFEINPRHPFVASLLALVDELEEDEVDKTTDDAAWMLHDLALLNSGYSISDIESYSNRMTRVIQNVLSVESLDLEEELDVPVEEEVPPIEDGDEFGEEFVDMDMDREEL